MNNLTNSSSPVINTDGHWTFWARKWTRNGTQAAFGVRCTIEVYRTRLLLGGSPTTSVDLSSISDCRVHFSDPLFRDYVTHVSLRLTAGDEIRIQLVNPVRPYDVVRSGKEAQAFADLLKALAQDTETRNIPENPYLRSASQLEIELPINPDGWKADLSPWVVERRYWPRPWYVVSETLPPAWLPGMLVGASLICIGLAMGIIALNR